MKAVPESYLYSWEVSPQHCYSRSYTMESCESEFPAVPECSSSTTTPNTSASTNSSSESPKPVHMDILRRTQPKLTSGKNGIAMSGLVNPIAAPTSKHATTPSKPAEHEIKIYLSPPLTDSASPPSTSTSTTSPPTSTSPTPPPKSSQTTQAENKSPEEIEAEQIRIRVQEFVRVGLDYYAGKVVKKEGGKVWQPRFAGDQWTKQG
jgi:hypothetical protein